MIIKLELEEYNYGYDSILINFDLKNNNMIYIKNDNILKKEVINIDNRKFSDSIKKYITHWDTKYIENKIIDGNNSILKIYTDKEVVEYTFKNKFPYNYNEFLIFLKEAGNING